MRILLINEVCGTGSTGRICSDLASTLEKQGHNVRIAYGRDNDVPDKDKHLAIRIGNKWDVICHAVLTRMFDMAGFGSRRATIRFIKWVEEYNPDIIHLHNLHGYYINVGLLFEYLRRCNKKIVWTLHDCWAYTGHSAYCDAVQCEKWKSGCGMCPQLNMYPKSYIDRSKKNWLYKKYIFSDIPNLTIVCPSKWLAGQVKQSYLGKYPTKVIHNGVNTSVFHYPLNDFRRVYQLENYYLILGVKKVWTSQNGFDEFIKLAKTIENDTKIVLVGKIKIDDKKELPNNVINLSSINSPREMANIYSSCDVFYDPINCSDSLETINTNKMDCGELETLNDIIKCKTEAYLKENFKIKNGDYKGVLGEINNLRKLNRENRNGNINSADIPRYSGMFELRKEHNLLGKKILISVATVWNDLKGQTDLIEIARRLPSNSVLIMIGEVRAKNLKNIPDNIIFIPKTKDVMEMANYYGMSDLYVNCTYCDTYPTVNLESLSCGTPIATYEVGGSAEIAKSWNGKCCPRGNVSKMLEIIESVSIENYFKSELNKPQDSLKSIEEYIKLYGLA